MHRHEKLDFRLMMVPRKLTLELHELHVLPVQFNNDLRGLVLREQSTFFGKFYLLHLALINTFP